MVNTIRERRPVSTETNDGVCKGRVGWQWSQTDDRIAHYVCKNCLHHVSKAWQPEWDSDHDAIAWLDDYSMLQDVVSVAAAAFLGSDRTSQLAERAVAAGNWWSASLRYSAAALNVSETIGGEQAAQYFIACATCLASVHPTELKQQRNKDKLEFSTVLAILMRWNPKDMPVYMPRLAKVGTTDVAYEDPER